MFAAICLILVLFLAPPEMPQGALVQERGITAGIVGEASEEKVYAISDQWHGYLVDQDAWHARVHDIDLPLTHRYNLRAYLDDRVEAATALIEIGCYRLAGIWIWLMLALPMFVAVIMDAVMTRKARQHQFRYVSHTLQRASGAMIGTIIALLIVGMFVPYPLPYMLTAFLIVPLGWLTWNWIANLPKRI
ncbi:MAG: DUF4400 domain-containing protein [Candidatus Thiodiazotropha sp. (ex. Lucinoma kazani)]